MSCQLEHKETKKKQFPTLLVIAMIAYYINLVQPKLIFLFLSQLVNSIYMLWIE